MNKLFASIAVAAAMLAAPLTSRSQDIINMGEYDGNLISFGARIGFNASNMSDTKDGKSFSLDSWGTGFDAGVVVDLRLRDWFSIQPGFFFQSRSHNYSYVYDVVTPLMPGAILSDYGHTRRTLFKVPVLFSLKLHPGDGLLWSVDLGPTFNFGLGGHEWGHSMSLVETEYKRKYYKEFNSFMMGLKMGTGVQVLDHYYLGVHYEAGLRSARKNGKGGRDKAWTFTIGYDF